MDNNSYGDSQLVIDVQSVRSSSAIILIIENVEKIKQKDLIASSVFYSHREYRSTNYWKSCYKNNIVDFK